MKHGPRTILLKLLTILLSGSPFRWWTRQQLTAGLIPQRLQRSLDNELVQLPHKATNAKIAGPAGTRQLKIFVMVNIKKFPRGINSDPVISGASATASVQRAPGPGLQVTSHKLPGPRPISNANKGLIHKRQASSNKFRETQASSGKRQAPSTKAQASSRKHQAL